MDGQFPCRLLLLFKLLFAIQNRKKGGKKKERMSFLCFLSFSIELILVFLRICNAGDAISPPQSLMDGETLISKGGIFELGFFTPGHSLSQKRYLGIWYKKIPIRTVVWVANRETPIRGSSGVLKICPTGTSLVLFNESNETNAVWISSSSLSPKTPLNHPIAQLLDSGNLVLREENSTNADSYMWQSFDYPSDTLLQGMKLGWDSKRGLNRRITSWTSPDDPSPGELVYEVTHDPYPQALFWKGSEKFYRAGPWNGRRFSGSGELKSNPVFDYQFVTTPDEVYYIFQIKNKSVVSMLVMNQTTLSRQRYIWVPSQRAWEVYITAPRGYCDEYGLCGANSVCIFSESPVCRCLKGFKPKSQGRWNLMDWSQGCIRHKPLECGNGDGFAKFEWLKLPDTSFTWVNTSMNLRECRAKCLANCSCTAYTNSDISGKGSGCVMWFEDLMDIRESAGGQELFIRMCESELGVRKGLTVKWALVAVAATAIVSGMLITSYCIWISRANIREIVNNQVNDSNNEGQGDLEVQCFSLATIVNATSNFSDNNKLGEGGFGPVYMGTLVDGRQIAVKRLLQNSRQGLTEFKNEVMMIAKLQHRNLVKLLGSCIEGEEMMLIYEYMPNKSLDSFIFDHTRGKLLEWPKRFHIICGVARGLLYLHQDSRFRIIHRDLKVSNILLDGEMNPKISDFGLARSFGTSESADRTRQIVGTYGYMSPEYAIDGLFSIKSDVYSFGVLLLEIVTGEKNRGFHCPSHGFNLLGHAWKLWTESRPFELTDALSYEEYCPSEVLRCIHVGLLCVQQCPEDRPNMSSVVVMLVSEIPMPQPKQPGFFINRNPSEEVGSSSSKNKSESLLIAQ